MWYAVAQLDARVHFAHFAYFAPAVLHTCIYLCARADVSPSYPPATRHQSPFTDFYSLPSLVLFVQRKHQYRFLTLDRKTRTADLHCFEIQLEIKCVTDQWQKLFGANVSLYHSTPNYSLFCVSPRKEVDVGL